MKLYIAEKPSLARALAVGIGDGKNCDGYISLKFADSAGYLEIESKIRRGKAIQNYSRLDS